MAAGAPTTVSVMWSDGGSVTCCTRTPAPHQRAFSLSAASSGANSSSSVVYMYTGPVGTADIVAGDMLASRPLGPGSSMTPGRAPYGAMLQNGYRAPASAMQSWDAPATVARPASLRNW